MYRLTNLTTGVITIGGGAVVLGPLEHSDIADTVFTVNQVEIQALVDIGQLAYIIISSSTAIYGVQYMKNMLIPDEVWLIDHPSDPDFKRLLDIYQKEAESELSLDFDLADRAQFHEENSAKTDFIGGGVLLKEIGIITSNVYGHWHLNEGIGTLTLDSSGNGRNGVIIGPNWIDGKLNKALHFLGTEYVDLANIARWEYTQPFSAEAWFKTTSVAGNHTIICTMEATHIVSYRGWQLSVSAGGSVGLKLRDTNWNELGQWTTAGGYNDGNWHHVVATYDGSNTPAGIILYIDGSPVPMTVDGTGLFVTMVPNAACCIGSRNKVEWFYQGDLDEIVLYDKVLSPAEVTFRYNSGNGREIMGEYDTTKGWYVRTDFNQIDTSAWEMMVKFLSTEELPTGTQIKYLISVNDKVTWKKWNGSDWVAVDLVDIDADGNTAAELTALTRNDWYEIFVPETGTLDLVMSLQTTNDALTPSIDQIMLNYLVPGGYRSINTRVLLTLVDSTHSSVKNITTDTFYDVLTNFALII